MPAAAVGDGWVGGRSGWWRASIAASCSTLPLTVNICRAPRDGDVTIKVLFCGICHTDLHIIKNEWGNTMFPVVPGCVTDTRSSASSRPHGCHQVRGRGHGGRRLPHPRAAFLRQLPWRAREPLQGRARLQRRGPRRRHHPGWLLRLRRRHRPGIRRSVARVPGRLPPEAASPLLCAGHGMQQPHDTVRPELARQAPRPAATPRR